MQRRTFLKAVTATSLMTFVPTESTAKTKLTRIDNSNILTENEFLLNIDYTQVNITGKNPIVTTVNRRMVTLTSSISYDFTSIT